MEEEEEEEEEEDDEIGTDEEEDDVSDASVCFLFFLGLFSTRLSCLLPIFLIYAY